MPPLATIGFRLLLFSVLGTIAFCLLIVGYAILRGLRMPVNWVVWISGTVFSAASVLLCLTILLPNQFGAARFSGNPVGLVSFLLALYSAGQWATRQWYRQIKQRTTTWLANGSRNLMLFLRRHHVFLGWVVALTALGHMVYYLPILAGVRQVEVITGFLAVGILALVVLLGLGIWLQVTVRKQRMPQRVHTIHSALALAFLVTLMAHMMLVF